MSRQDEQDGRKRLVDVELVALGIGHRHRVVVQSLLEVRAQARGSEGLESCSLSLDRLAPVEGAITWGAAQSITSW